MRLIDGNELLGIERLLDTDIVRQSKVASWLLDQVLHDIQAMPTLTPPNEPLTLEELKAEAKRQGYKLIKDKHPSHADVVAAWNAMILKKRKEQTNG